MLSSAGCAWLQDRRDENKGVQLQSLRAPDGYRVSVLATELPKARHMAIGTRGTLFVGSMAGNVYALSLNGEALAGQRTILNGLTDSSGVAFRDGSLFVADRTRILRFDDIEQRLDNPGAPVTVVDGLGMRFDTSAKTSADTSMIVARHGSHPPERIGYDVVRVRLQANMPPKMEPFLTGFLQGRSYWGRPVDVLMMADGSVLISDDLNGVIYRVTRS